MARDARRPGRSRVAKAVGDRRPRRPLEMFQHDWAVALTRVRAESGVERAPETGGGRRRSVPWAARAQRSMCHCCRTNRAQSLASSCFTYRDTGGNMAGGGKMGKPRSWLPSWACKAHRASQRRSHLATACPHLVRKRYLVTTCIRQSQLSPTRSVCSTASYVRAPGGNAPMLSEPVARAARALIGVDP